MRERERSRLAANSTLVPQSGTGKRESRAPAGPVAADRSVVDGHFLAHRRARRKAAMTMLGD
jgi:hypothetical protein